MLVAGCVVTFVAELAVPLLFVGGRRVRFVAAVAVVVFQVLIFLTGNYTFFNLLTIALAVWLLDDARVAGWLPRRILDAVPPPVGSPNGWRRYALVAIIAVLTGSSGVLAFEALGGTVPRRWTPSSVRSSHSISRAVTACSR